jgi:hypothetical protein
VEQSRQLAPASSRGDRTDTSARERREEPLNTATPSGYSRCREDELNLQIRADLVQVLRGKIAAIIGIEDLWNTANVPARIFLTPNGLAQRQRGVNCRRSLK